MQTFFSNASSDPILAIGLMSGTSADGVDAALVEIQGCSTNTKVKQLGFVSIPYTDEMRSELLRVAGGEAGGSQTLCLLNFRLGSLFADACEAVCREAGIEPSRVQLVGNHGHTVYHAPAGQMYLGSPEHGTLQIGEASVIAERLGCAVVSDFRVRDMAAGGYGAPLVPYTEYLLYRSETETVALQNIGGIGNITILPAGCRLEDVYAFDTGPGNMVMDALAERATNGTARYDAGGRMAAQGAVSQPLLDWMMQDPYLSAPPPKTTGREQYGAAYVEKLVQKGQEYGLGWNDLLATAARFTAESIRVGLERFCPHRPDRLIVGGGGSLNPTLLAHISDCLPGCRVMINEDMGLDSNAKEAVAFAVLANEFCHGVANNAPKATGAEHPVIMGKLTLA